MDASNNLPVIADVEIPVDSTGRYNLNALHKASHEGEHKRPSKWLDTSPAQEFIAAVRRQSPQTGSGTKSDGYDVLRVVNGGNAPGTFAHELIAVEYAGWISPEFRIKVNQTFIDYRTGKIQPAPLSPANMSRLQLIQLAMQAEEERLALEHQVAEIQPKAAALDRIATASEGALNVTSAAKHLQMRPKALFQWLSAHEWIYRRPGSTRWLAYQVRLQAGLLEHKVTTVTRDDGTEKVVEQVLVTAKGLTRLAQELGVDLEGVA